MGLVGSPRDTRWTVPQIAGLTRERVVRLPLAYFWHAGVVQ